MSNFNPDEFLADINPETDSFNPDEFINPDLSQDQLTLQRYEQQQEQFGKPLDTLAAAALATGRGALLGLTDLALTESGLVKPETLKGLADANPIASTVGNIGGSAATIIGTGGAGALTKGLGTTARVAGQAAEGALFGAGAAVSDYAMGDPNLNAQKIAAHVGTGMLFGGGAGLLGEGIAYAAPKVTQALSNSLTKLKESVGSKAGEILEGQAPNWAEKFNLGLKMGDTGPTIKSRELVKNLDDIVSSSKKAATSLYEEAAPANIGKALENTPTELAKANFDDAVTNIKMKVNGIADIATDEGFALSNPKSLKVVNTLLDDLEHSSTKFKTAKDYQEGLSKFVKTLDKELKERKLIRFDTLPTATQMSDQDVLRNISKSIRTDLKNPEKWGEAATHYAEVSDVYSKYKNAYTNFKKDFMKTEISSSGIKKDVIDPSKVQSFFNKFDDVKYDLKKQHLNEFIDQTDLLAKASENYHGFEKGAESISEYVKSLASKNEELAKLASIMKGSGLNSTLTRDSVGALAASAVGVPNPLIGATLGAMKLYEAAVNPYLAGRTLSNSVGQLKAIGEIVEKTTKQINNGAKAIFSSNVPRGISVGITSTAEKEYNKNYKQIKELASNPDKLMQHVEKTAGGLSEAAPNISVGLTATINRGVAFLDAKRPKPNNELPLNSKWEPTYSQKAKFNRYVQAVNDPISALKMIKNGTLSNETMEALQAVHPDLLEQMQQDVMMNMDAKKLSSLSYTVKIGLSKFLGQPLESSMLPKVLEANQSTFAMPANKNSPQQTQPKSKSTLGGLKQLEVSNRNYTEVQKNEAESE